MTLGLRIQELRKNVGLSQEKLGEELNVSRQAVSKWESDGGIPELDSLIAMSKLFGVTVGQLLGVEEPQDKGTPAEDGATVEPVNPEELVEAVLRRYVEETKEHTKPKGGRRRILAACAAVVLLGAGAWWVCDQITTLRGAVNNVDSQFSWLQTGLQNQISRMEYTIQDILNTQASLFSDSQWSLESFDVERQTVTLGLSATLKSWTPGTRGRFVLTWDGGEPVQSGWLAGPEYRAEVEVPMNDEVVSVKLVLEDPDGVVMEQVFQESLYGIGRDAFQVNISYFLARITGLPYQMLSVDVDSELWSSRPNQIWPEEAELIVLWDGAELCRVPIELGDGDNGCWDLHDTVDMEMKLESGGNLSEHLAYVLRVTDNLGQVTEAHDKAFDGAPAGAPPPLEE